MEFFTQGGVRLRRRRQGAGSWNWLFLPGGPGIGSESLHELADALDVPGSLWMVDLPGDGSNVREGEVYDTWPEIVLEAATALSDVIFIGHSTGGMYLLSVPELEACLRGLVLVSSAPDADWRQPFFEMTQRHPLAEVDVATRRYEATPNPETLAELAVATAPWNFQPAGLAMGRDLLRRMPYNAEAVAWSDRHFDAAYALKWWPRRLPTLIVSGRNDRIVKQDLWNRADLQGAHVHQRWIPEAGHFPWIEQPALVADAFADFAGRLR